MDQSGLYAMEDMLQDLRKKKIEIFFISLLEQPRYMMERIDIIPDLIPEDSIFENFNDCTKLPTADLERRVLGFDHHQVSTTLLQAWALPSLLTDVLLYWGTPDTLPVEVDDATQALCRLIYMADMTCDVIWHSQKDQALRTLHESGRASFGIAATEIDAYFLSLDVNLTATATLLDVDIATLNDFSTILDDARDQMMQISLGAVLDLQHTAAHAQELEQEKQHLAALSQTDSLTGLLNRAGFDSTLQQIIDARLEGNSDQALGLLMIDIDHFKTFNDTYGHLIGDSVLKQVAKWIEAATRYTDVAARYGGEEFVVVVPNTSIDILKHVAERIRMYISERTVRHQDEPLAVTVSVGGACVQQVRTLEDGMILLKIADQCLYEAKNTGRNCSICCELSGLLA
jgi:diguanylate cyclase (GGDEF)-like protein